MSITRCYVAENTLQTGGLMKLHRFHLAVTAMFLAGGVLVGCSGSGVGLDSNGQPIKGSSATPPLEANFQSIQANVFTPICARCHSGGSAPEGLQLDAAHSYALLVGVPSVEVPSVLRVKPGDPDNSYLIMKLEGAPGIVGAQMPFGGPYLPQSTIDVIRQWIIDGALESPSASTAEMPRQHATVLPQAGGTDVFAVTATSPLADSTVAAPVTLIVIAFNHDLDASLVNDTTVRVVRKSPSGEPYSGGMTSAIEHSGRGSWAASEQIAVLLTIPAGDAHVLVITPPSPLTAGSYRVILRGRGGGALADLDAVTLGTIYSFGFKVVSKP